jgi:hypothetical protein
MNFALVLIVEYFGNIIICAKGENTILEYTQSATNDTRRQNTTRETEKLKEE